MGRCDLCLQKHQYLNTTYRHSISKHSKTRLVNELLRSRHLLCSNRSKSQAKPTVIEKRHSNANTFLTSNSLKLTMKPQELKLTDCKHEVQYIVPWKYGNRQSRSADDADTSFTICHLEITPIPQALQGKSNDFYVCSCKKSPAVKKRKKFIPITSDTDSCSDSEPKFNCLKCSNGYRSKETLVQHLYQHLQINEYAMNLKQEEVNIYICPICKSQFDSEFMLYQHIQMMEVETRKEEEKKKEEERVVEDVLDMQEEYIQNFNGVPNFNTGANLEDVIKYLTDTHL